MRVVNPFRLFCQRHLREKIPVECTQERSCAKELGPYLEPKPPGRYSSAALGDNSAVNPKPSPCAELVVVPIISALTVRYGHRDT